MTKININMILEILGRPPENVENALKLLVEKMQKEKGVEILSHTLHPPVKVKESENLYTSFVEINAELESIDLLFGLIFSYMPSNIELNNPEKIELTNNGFNDLANKIVSRLHEYEALTKNALVERQILLRKLNELEIKVKSQDSAVQKVKTGETLKKKESKKVLKKKK